MQIVPANLRDPRIETAMIGTRDGLTFEVDHCGEGDELALCLHGFPEHSFSWRYQLPMLADLGFTAWAPNLRGYGNSSRPEGLQAYRVDELVEDAEAAMARAFELANMVTRRSPTAVGAFKEGLLASLSLDEEARQEREALAYELCVDSGEANIGRTNFKAITSGETVQWGPRRTLNK